ncbi:MAG: F0F1 ATP synthase subunit beta, partial [Oscillospiraceae bacterium]|nr:F0F1 ATP synthase subunit beta [Oscillospiraceae bacterium]
MVLGTVIRIIGPVVDVRFPVGQTPAVRTLVYIVDGNRRVAAEVSHHLPDAVRCIAIEATEGLRRGLPVESTGAPITVPVGERMLG